MGGKEVPRSLTSFYDQDIGNDTVIARATLLR